MRKTYLLNGFVAMALGLAAVGCTHDADYSEHHRKAQIVAEYNNVFVKVFGEPAADQDWGFGTSSGTRAAADTWTLNHTDGWESYLGFPQTSDELVEQMKDLGITAIDITAANFRTDGTVYYIPENFNGDVLDLGYKIEFKGGMSLYNFGKVSGGIRNVNFTGTDPVSFYNAKDATLTFDVQSGGEHNIYNTGDLTVCQYQNIDKLYNSGELVLERNHHQYWSNDGGRADIPDDMSIYSAGDDAKISLPDGASSFKATCDIHHTVYATDYFYLENSRIQYICGLEITGNNSVLKMVAGNLQTSFVKANEIEFMNGATSFWLLPEAHVVANKILFKPSGNYFHGYEGSNAFVETTDFYFENKNDLTHSFSNNIYFKVSGSIEINGCFKNAHSEEWKKDHPSDNGQYHKYTNMDDYLANTEDEYNLVAGRLNAGNTSGSPACGLPWNTPKGEEWIFQCRIFAEDLTVSEASDFDFNDVVFDVYYNQDRTDTKIQLLAAGGTLPLTVDGTEVHAQFGLDNTTTMINTGDVDGVENNLKADAYKLNRYVEPINIAIMVFKNGQWIELEAKEGKPAAKFAVADQSMEWCDERQNIDEKYNFSEWVKNPSNVLWYK